MGYYYEDFTVGQQFKSPRSYVIDKESAVAFAREFDPQAQHTDEEGLKDSLFSELIVSGWHTAAATMRLKTETEFYKMAGGVVGIGLDGVRWPNPVYPGDSIRMVMTITEMRELKSRPDKGLIKYKVETFNQKDVLVLEMLITVIVPKRSK